MPSSVRWRHSLAARFGVVLGLFVVGGSLLLLAWLRHQQRQESERVFATLAQTDADFVKRLNLPRSARLAHDLRQLLGMRIYFRAATGVLEPPLPDDLKPLEQAGPRDEVYRLPGRQEALVLRLDRRHDMLFVRDAAEPALSLLNPATRNALLAFWIFSAALGWVIAGQVLRPVGDLTRKLPALFTSSVPVLPEAERKDEIGHLARALTQARDDLLEERMRREQSDRLALLGRVATGLAHEIKNPLASIQLHADLMSAPAGDGESERSLQHIRDESRVIEGLVNQWLYLARPAPPQRALFDLRECVHQMLASVRGQAEHAGVVVTGPEVETATAVKVWGDRGRLQQAFRNILINGIQAMPAGGSLRVGLAMEAGRVCLTFRDTGPGFTSTALERGMDLFFSEKEGGMGVGLNVVGEIICAHEGNVVLKNCPNGGALVELYLPVDLSMPEVVSSS